MNGSIRGVKKEIPVETSSRYDPRSRHQPTESSPLLVADERELRKHHAAGGRNMVCVVRPRGPLPLLHGVGGAFHVPLPGDAWQNASSRRELLTSLYANGLRDH